MSTAPTPTTPTAAQTTEGCRYCWMCRQSCPVGFVTARETFTPHAWALTIESVKRGQLTWTPETRDVLYACADCGLCRANCATDRPLPDAIAAARAEVVAAGLAPAAAYDVEKKLKAHGNPYVASSPAASTARGDVALFVGDAALHLGKPALDALRRLLEAAGITAVPIAAGRSTGSIASSLGFAATARDLADAVLAEVAASGCSRLIVVSPADRWAFERVYPDRLGLTWPAGVVIEDAATVLAHALDNGRLRLRPDTAAPAWAYHDPCHSPRVPRDAQAPRRLLAAAFGEAGHRELFWREHRAHPCGAVGGLEFTQPAIASALARARIADALAAGARWLLTEDPACLHQIRTADAGGIEVMSLFEALAGRL
jgi:Fe-S oxidoreductase